MFDRLKPAKLRKQNCSHGLLRQRSLPRHAIVALGCELLEQRHLLAVITVDSLADNLDDDGQITLREAVHAANTDGIADATEGVQAGDGADVIRFAESVHAQTIHLTQGELAITGPATIEGPTGSAAVNISGNQLSRVFRIDDGDTSTTIDVRIIDLILGDGMSANDGGAIWSSEELTLRRVAIYDSSAGNDGGGLFANGPLAIEDGSSLAIRLAIVAAA